MFQKWGLPLLYVKRVPFWGPFGALKRGEKEGYILCKMRSPHSENRPKKLAFEAKNQLDENNKRKQ